MRKAPIYQVVLTYRNGSRKKGGLLRPEELPTYLETVNRCTPRSGIVATAEPMNVVPMTVRVKGGA